MRNFKEFERSNKACSRNLRLLRRDFKYLEMKLSETIQQIFTQATRISNQFNL